MNHEGAGGAKGKGGDNARALNRSMGYNATMGAMHSKTRSNHHSSAKPYHYEGCSGYGSNENVNGYKGGNKT